MIESERLFLQRQWLAKMIQPFNIEELGILQELITEKLTAVYSRRYNTEPPDYAHIFPIEEWNDAVSCGSFNNDDGCGYWVKDGKECSDEVFGSEAQDATHVAWYNK